MIKKFFLILAVGVSGFLAVVAAMASGPNFNDTDVPAANSLNPVFSGNVGIGTTAPVGRLEVDGNIYVKNANIGIGTSAPAAALDIIGVGATSASANMLLRNAGRSVLMTVLNDGNIGIGTTAPAALLEIKGSGNNIFNATSGNVGIGTTAPAQKLDVTGTVRASTLMQTSGTSSGRVACWKANGTLGYCSGAYSSGSCTCN